MSDIWVEWTFCELFFWFEAVSTFSHAILPLVLYAVVSLKSIWLVERRKLHFLVSLRLLDTR